MLERIIAFIMSILMTIFPFFFFFLTISNEEVAEAVIYAVKNKDASAMEAVMCKNIKDNYPNLTDEINKMLSYIEGDIESITWKKFGGCYINDGYGKAMNQIDHAYDIITTKGVYGFTAVIETDNSFNPEELGIRSIGLHTLIENPNPNSSYKYIYGVHLYKISATEGIGELHD